MCELAVFTPLLGARTETFIRRHVRDLLPGRTLVLANRGAAERDWSVDGPCITLGPKPSRRESRRVVKELRAHGVRVLLGEYLDCTLPLLDIAAEAGVDLFAHAHGYDVSSALRKMDVRSRYREYAHVAGVVTVSQAQRNALVELGLDPTRVLLVPYGVDVPEAVPERGARDDGVVSCIAVGRLVPKKAPLALIRAFATASVTSPDLRLELVGDGPLMPRVRALVREAGLEEKITLHGSLPGEVVQQMLAKADVFLQHSVVDPDTGDAEGLPVAILEAMAQALPIVSTRHGGIPDAIVDGVNGLLVEENDERAMAERLLELKGDPERRRALGRAAWTTARSRFAWPTQRRALLSVLSLDAGAP